MAVTITEAEVKEFISAAESVSSADLAMYIEVANEADDCLDANVVGNGLQRLLKLNAVAHLITKSNGGQLKSQRDFDGAQITFKGDSDAQGLSSTSYGQTVRSLDFHGCYNYLDVRKGRFVTAVGRNYE